jgi:hypothetical protein
MGGGGVNIEFFGAAGMGLWGGGVSGYADAAYFLIASN